MGKCNYCKKEMMTADSCNFNKIIIDGKEFKRIDGDKLNQKYDMERCGDCGIKLGRFNYHHFNCDLEECPKCGGQLLSCDCNATELKGLKIKV